MTWARETLVGGSDGWFMPCAVCGTHLREGAAAWVQEDADGNGLFARCPSHGDPNAAHRIVRYLVVVERDHDADGAGEYHNGTGAGAVAQLSKELQEGWDTGAIAGHFRIINRVLVDDPDLADMGSLPTYYEDDPVDPRLLAMLELERSLRNAPTKGAI